MSTWQFLILLSAILSSPYEPRKFHSKGWITVDVQGQIIDSHEYETGLSWTLGYPLTSQSPELVAFLYSILVV